MMINEDDDDMINDDDWTMVLLQERVNNDWKGPGKCKKGKNKMRQK